MAQSDEPLFMIYVNDVIKVKWYTCDKPYKEATNQRQTDDPQWRSATGDAKLRSVKHGVSKHFAYKDGDEDTKEAYNKGALMQKRKWFLSKLNKSSYSTDCIAVPEKEWSSNKFGKDTPYQTWVGVRETGDSTKM